ncbi:MAG: TRAP transporter large permease [Thermovirgaceae bacterium]
MSIAILFGLMILLIFVGVPIGITIGVSTAVTMFFWGSMPLMSIAQKAYTGLDSFPLLAVPFFILAGSLMCNGGISKRLINLAETLVGCIIGGLSMVTVMACMFFAAISGSGPATVSAIGSFMIPAMKERDYGGGFAAAVTATAGTIGVIIPPSIPFVIYCIVAQVSIGDMFIAGIIPGIIIGLSIMATCYVMARKRNYVTSTTRPTFRGVLTSLKEAWWAMMIPVIILGGIYGGVFTPTEAAVVSVVYALFIGVFVYKELNFEMIYKSMRETALINGSLMFMIGLSIAFANYISLAQVPAKIAAFLTSFSDSPFILMLIINVFLLAIGCFIDNIAAVVILTPILLPVVTRIGIDPIHFGLIITFNLAIGFITPPYGINLFVASTVSKESIEKISWAILPFIVVLILCLLVFTNFPIFTTGILRLIR